MPGTARRIGIAATAAVLAGLGGAGVVTAPPVALAATGASDPAAAGAGRVALPSPVPAWAASLTDLGPAGRAVTMSIRVYLAGRSPAAQARFTAAASTPGHPAYGHYLTPAQFQSRFGTTKSQNAAVQAWAKSAGLTVTGGTSHYVAVTGPAPALGRALDTSIRAYGSPSFTSGYAPAGGMSVPASLGGDVTTVTGLDKLIDQGTPTAGSTKQARLAAGGFTCSAWWGQHVSAIPKADGRTSAPDGVCGYTPAQLRSAYGVRSGSGQGATIAIVLDGSLSTMRADANRFFAAHQVPGFSPGQFTVNTGPGFAASCGGSSDVPEEPLDVETAHIIAPAAKVVYVAANCTSDSNQTGLLDAETRVVDQHLADVSTESYSIVENQFTPADAAAWTQVFAQGAAEGVGFDFDSGDGGDLSGGGPAGETAVTFPASDPWATAVGGTTLQIGRSGAVAGELGWGDTGAQENTAGSGYVQPLPGTFEEGRPAAAARCSPSPATSAAWFPPRCPPAAGRCRPTGRCPISPPTPAPSPAG